VIAPNVIVINKHFHLDHARGNKYYPNALVISGETNWRQWGFDTAHSKRPDVVLKPGERRRIEMDDEVIEVIDFGNEHSPNDLVAFFKKRKVLAVGDLVWTNMHPMLLDGNSDLGQWSIYLQRILDEFDADKVVPGHGKICEKDAVINMLEYYDTISELLNDPEKLK
jgi:glyoxylase-like metal-dependent hydrolase (beta-lactamase superfamily II)